MANYLASIFGTEQDVRLSSLDLIELCTNNSSRKSTAPSTTKSAPADTVTDAHENMSSHPIHKPYFYQISTRTQPTTQRTR